MQQLWIEEASPDPASGSISSSFHSLLKLTRTIAARSCAWVAVPLELAGLKKTRSCTDHVPLIPVLQAL